MGRRYPTKLRCTSVCCAGQAHPRKSKATHPAQAPAAQPTQTRTGGQSRRSSTRLGKRTHARLRAPASASGRIIPPNAGPRAQTTRTRQRRAAQAAQTAVGDAQIRILFRDDHVANTANVRLRRTKQKALFFGGIPVSFGKTKEMGYKLHYPSQTTYCPNTASAVLPTASLMCRIMYSSWASSALPKRQ